MKNQNNEQELLFRYSMFERQIKEIQQQLEAVERGIIDLDTLRFGLDELVGGKGKEIFASVGKGIFVKAEITSEELNVDIGNGNFVKKTIPEAKELIEEQIKKLGQVKEELEKNLGEIEKEITETILQTENHSENCKCKEGEKCSCGKCECEKEE